VNFENLYFTGSVATPLRYGKIFNDRFIANFPQSVTV